MDEQRSPRTALQFLCMGLGRSLCIIEPRSSAVLSIWATAHQWADRIADAAFIARTPDMRGEQLQYFACEHGRASQSRMPLVAMGDGRNAGRCVESASVRLLTIYAEVWVPSCTEH
jgi:hypothetical protein